jgi:hypothetical protein
VSVLAGSMGWGVGAYKPRAYEVWDGFSSPRRALPYVGLFDFGRVFCSMQSIRIVCMHADQYIE